MTRPLRLLIVEDDSADAKLVLAELRAAGFEPEWIRVETESDFLAELEKSPDIILADYSMPEFSGLRAVKLLQASGRDIPFILISGTVGEEVAVEAMKHGATDYLLKDRITRLGSAVERALDEAQAKRERCQTEETLRLLGTALEQTTESVVITDARLDLPGPAIVFVNPAYTRMTGYSGEESIGKTPWMLQGPLTDRAVLSRLRRNFEQGEHFAGETINYRKDGTEFDLEWRVAPVRNAGGEITHFVGVQRDITERKTRERELASAHRALKMLSTCNEAMIRAEHEEELLERICRIAVETGGYRMAWVGYAQDDEIRSIKPVAHAGAEDGYLSEINLSWNENDPLGQGPAGEVIRSGKPVVCADFTREPTLKAWHVLAERRGYHGLVKLPLQDQGRTFGLLGLYSAEVHNPGVDELKLLQELANDLAFGIVHLRASLDQQRLQAAVLQVAAGVSGATGTEFFEHLARHMAEALGAQAGFVSQFRPGEPLSASTLAVVVDGKVMSNFDYLIQGTPCENLAASDSYVIAEHVAEQFPQAERLAALGAQAYVGRRLAGSTGQSLGHLFAVFREPLGDTAFATSTMRIFAARAASELERLQTDAQVREQAALIDEARDAILVSDLDHRITFWSKGAERLYGWSAEDALGSLEQELLEIDRDTFAEADRGVRETGAWNGEIQKRSLDQAVLTLNGRWTLMRDADDQPRSILSIDTDITEQKKVQEQFLRAQRMESVGTLAGGIAHDLNNALSPIMMSLELLSLRFPDPKSMEVISTLRASAQHGAEMVRQVLSFARGVDGRRIVVPLGHLIREIENIANDTFLKLIKVKTEVSDKLWTVVGDPTQIHQVLLNLCVNARDAMRGGGLLSISADNLIFDPPAVALNLEAKVGPYICIEVSDTGIGIPPEVIEKIFDPFFTTKEVGKGTGLGLSTSLAIVKSHGGFIRVDSRPDRGTTFKVYLPAQREAVETKPIPSDTQLPRGQGELILVVDDEVSMRFITHATLEAFGYEVLLACDGTEAVAIYSRRQGEIAIVLTDMNMPVMDGETTIQLLRKIDPEVCVVAVSGLSISKDVASACCLEEKHILPKPYTAQMLLQTLKRVLSEEN